MHTPSNESISCILFPQQAEWLWRPDPQIGYPSVPNPNFWQTPPSTSVPNTHISVGTAYTAPKDYKVERFDDNRLLIFVKLPGFLKDEISIYIDQKYLYVMASSADSFVGENYETQIDIPDSDVVKAEFKDGMLIVHLDIKNKKKSIPIS